MNDLPKIEHLIESIVAGASTAQLEIECNEVDLNKVGIHGRTPLMVAAAAGFLATVEMLVRYGASVHATGGSQITALHEASANGEVAVANYLLSLGAEVDAESIDGATPLMCAAAWGNTEVARLLLENGADRTKTDRSGATAADIAREKGEDNTAELIDSYSDLRDTNAWSRHLLRSQSMSTTLIISRLDKELASMGFVRQKTTWNRCHDQLVEVIDIQNSKAGDTVTMNVGMLERDAYSLCWGHEPAPFVEEPFCTVRARIGQLIDGKDCWWALNDASAGDEMVACLRERILPFLARMHSLEEMCNWLASTGAPSSGFPLASMCFAVLQSKLGNESQACSILADLQDNALGAWKARAAEVSARIGCN